MDHEEVNWWHRLMLIVVLTFLGIVFRELYWVVDHRHFMGMNFYRILEGSASGFGVAIGIILFDSWKLLRNCVGRYVPYCCGGFGVLFVKLYYLVFISPRDLQPPKRR